jgi:phosphatidylglycerophosphate synthase
MSEQPWSDRFVILADESAGWELAGLPQLDRLVLVLSEFAESVSPEAMADVVIFWKPDLAKAMRWLPRHPKMRRVHLTESLQALYAGARVMNTRLFIDRNALARFMKSTRPIKMEATSEEPASFWNQLNGRLRESCREGSGAGLAGGWAYLEGPADVRACERMLLRGLGKSQDGLVSKLLNRRISRATTRLLLKFPITPTMWTVSLLFLPLLGSIFLMAGGYADMIVGTAIYQLYNIFDGCDGEIARAKYLESERGRRLDAFCDLAANLLFAISLGFGLFRTTKGSSPSLYLGEGIATAVLIALRLRHYIFQLLATDATEALVPEHDLVIQTSGARLFGSKVTGFLFQITKRDVAFFAFLLLAIAGWPAIILHILFAFAVASAFLTTGGGKTVRPR